MKNKWNKQLIALTIEDFTELSDYYLEHTAKETCDYFSIYKKMLLPKTIENSKLKCLLANGVKIWVSKDYAFALEYLKQQQIEIANYRR